ncbi:MAG: hypothetical protein ACW97Z_09570 [Candidatus Hodarchaeales archaeon]|jgi:hypothetical protein
MSENKENGTDKHEKRREYTVPQGFSWYGISSGHSVSVKQLQNRSILKDLLFGIITILGVIIILLILR